jgi:ABC-type microcin C transport system permease subunit YejB
VNPEAELDIEDVIGLAPKATIDVYEAPSGSSSTSQATSTIDDLNQVANDDAAQVVSVSYGYCESGITSSELQAINTVFEQMASQAYIVTARAKGLSRWSQLTRHALRNSLMGLVTIFGLQVALLFGLTVIVEEIFGLPGIGEALLTAINDRDAPLVEGIVLVLAGIVVIVNLLIDVTYGVLDPRIRHGRSSV